jgi:NAD dependent epimerase/dehydratase family enzyme
VIANPKISGPVNFSSPETADNRSLMATLRRVVGIPFGVPAWRFMIEPVMWLLRTESELVLKSRFVVPEKLMKAGYKFRFAGLEAALREVYEKRKRPAKK